MIPLLMQNYSCDNSKQKVKRPQSQDETRNDVSREMPRNGSAHRVAGSFAEPAGGDNTSDHLACKGNPEFKSIGSQIAKLGLHHLGRIADVLRGVIQIQHGSTRALTRDAQSEQSRAHRMVAFVTRLETVQS